MNQNVNFATAEAEVRQTEVNQEFSRVEERASYIDKLVEELEAKLSNSILAQRKQGGSVDGQGTSEPVRVPVAQRLYELGSRLERVREHLSSILSRIEA